MTTGTEWLIDAAGCAPALLSDPRTMRALCDEIVRELQLQVVGEPAWHQFPGPGGVTGIYLLTESHLTCHTFPETGTATFNLYCCRPRAAWPWREKLAERLRSSRVAIRVVVRGTAEGTGDRVDEPFAATAWERE